MPAAVHRRLRKHEATHDVLVMGGKVQRDDAAAAPSGNRYRPEAKLPDKRRRILSVLMPTCGCSTAPAVPASVVHDYTLRAREIVGDAVPAARVEPDSVDQEQRRPVPELTVEQAGSSHRRRRYRGHSRGRLTVRK